MCSEISFSASFFPKGVSLVWKWFLIPLGCSLYSTLYPEENCCFIVLRQNPAMKPRLDWNLLCSEFQADFELMAVLLSHLPHESFIHVFVGRRTCYPVTPVWRAEDGVVEFSLPCVYGFQGLNSGHQASI